MKIQEIDILSNEVLNIADAICFTSNGVLKNNGALVMGAGNAKLFRDAYKGIDANAGLLVKENGNICQIVLTLNVCKGNPFDGIDRKINVVAFPTKHHWRNGSDIQLIRDSAKRLKALADKYDWKNVFLPAPGAGMGGLNFNKHVQPIIEEYLDDRFTITVYKGKGNK